MDVFRSDHISNLHTPNVYNLRNLLVCLHHTHGLSASIHTVCWNENELLWWAIRLYGRRYWRSLRHRHCLQQRHCMIILMTYRQLTGHTESIALKWTHRQTVSNRIFSRPHGLMSDPLRAFSTTGWLSSKRTTFPKMVYLVFVCPIIDNFSPSTSNRNPTFAFAIHWNKIHHAPLIIEPMQVT